MPVVPVNFRGGADFQPLDNVKDIIKFDGITPSATRVQDGTWLLWGVTGATKPAALPAITSGVKRAFCSFSDFDPNDVVGHPDSSRLGQITLLVGQYRGRTLYWLGPAAGNVTLAAGGAGGGSSQIPLVGDFMVVGAADAATVTRITQDAGGGVGAADATACVAGDGVLVACSAAQPVTPTEGVAICLSTADANAGMGAAGTGFIEYMML